MSPAIGDEVLALVLAIAALAAVAAVWPRRSTLVVLAWGAATAAVLGFAITRRFDVRPADVTYLWPYVAVRVLGGVLAGCVAAIAGWLIASYGGEVSEPTPSARTRHSG